MARTRQRLEQKLIQKLSPQQIQLIKLLEVPVMELEQRIKKEIEENPVLEEGSPEEYEDIQQQEFSAENDYETMEYDQEDSEEYQTDPVEEISYEDEFTPEDLIPDDEDIPYYKLTLQKDYSKEEKRIPYADTKSFRDFMLEQVGFSNLEGIDRQIAEYIIGSLDEDGYLRRDVESIASDLAIFYGLDVTPDQVEKVLRVIQQFDPPGVGARDLKEALLLQLERKLNEKPDNSVLILAKKVIENYFDEFIKKHYDKLKSKLGITSQELREVIDQIKHLNPKPANFYQPIAPRRNIQQIIPDFVLQDVNGQLYLSLNSGNVPPVRINKYYQDMVKELQKKGKKKLDNKEKETVNFLKQKIDSAKWFIDAIKQREETLYKTMKAIVDYQQDFFRTGDEAKLKPMILKDIAELTGLDISTISRVANSKYIQTPFGIYPLKYFFSEGLETEDGKEVSTREIKKILREAIENEDKSKPLTDEKLAKILQEKGYKIARRTVAKYREQMGIPVARLRKQI